MTTLTKARFLAHFRWSAAGLAVFDYQDANDLGRSIVRASQEWEDMGKPQTVTVTVEPGDLLNGQ